MTIQKRVSVKGKVSYLIKVSLGYKHGKQVTKSMTYRPKEGMKEKQIEREVTRQAVLFEEKIKQEYKKQLERENDLQEKESNEIEYAKKHLTFQQLADEWLELQEATHNLKHASLLRLKNCRERTYKAIGNVLISKLTYRKVQAFITSLSYDGVNQRTGKGLSEKSQKHYLNFISDIVKYGRRCGYIDFDPCKDILFAKSAEYKEEDIKYYSLEEEQKILELITEKAPTNHKLYFYLLAYLGLRRGEALGLEYKDFNQNPQTGKYFVSIRRTSNYRCDRGIYTDTPKTKSSHRVLYVAPCIIELLQKLRVEQEEQAKQCDVWQDTDRLFVTWYGEPMHPSTPYTWFERFCKREGLTFKGLHAFRHSYATLQIANGEDIVTVSGNLGHSQTSTTANIYAHTVQEASVKAGELMFDLLKVDSNK